MKIVSTHHEYARAGGVGAHHRALGPRKHTSSAKSRAGRGVRRRHKSALLPDSGAGEHGDNLARQQQQQKHNHRKAGGQNIRAVVWGHGRLHPEGLAGPLVQIVVARLCRRLLPSVRQPGRARAAARLARAPPGDTGSRAVVTRQDHVRGPGPPRPFLRRHACRQSQAPARTQEATQLQSSAP